MKESEEGRIGVAAEGSACKKPAWYPLTASKKGSFLMQKGVSPYGSAAPGCRILSKTDAHCGPQLSV